MTRRGVLLFVAMSVIWGTPYLMIRVAVGELTPFTLVFARTTIAALILMPIVLARGGLRGLGRRWIALVAFAAAEVGIPWIALTNAEQTLSSSLAGLLISAVPLVGTLIAPLFGNRDLGGPQAALGLVIGLVGVAAIAGFDFHAGDTFALLLMVPVVVGYAFGPAIANRFLRDLPSLTVNGVALSMCAIAFAPVGIALRPHFIPSIEVIGSVLGLAVICTALAFVLFFALIREVGPVRATVVTYLNPAVAAVLGVTILGESFTAGMAAGFVLVIIGSVLATRRPTAVENAEAAIEGRSA